MKKLIAALLFLPYFAAAQTQGPTKATVEGKIDKTESAAGNGLRNLKLTIGSPISVLVLGDSFNTGYYGGIDSVAQIRGAYRTLPVSGGGDSGVTPVTGAYDKSPDGTYYSIASGGNLTCGHLQFAQAGPADQVHYTLFPGTGTAQLQYSYSGGAWTNVGSAIDTTAITSVQCATVSLPFGYTDSVRCRVTATGGTVNGWIGQGMEGPGIMIASFATTGQSMAQSISVGETIWKAMLTAWGTDLVISSWYDGRFVDAAGVDDALGDDNWADDGPFDRAFDWSVEVNASIDWLIVSPHQVDPTATYATIPALDSAYAAVGIGTNAEDRNRYSQPFIRDFALDRGQAFVDCYHLFPSYAAALTQGMYSDTLHLSDKGKAYKAAHVLTNSGLSFALSASGAAGLKVGGVGFLNGTQNFGVGAGVGVYAWNGDTLPLFAGALYSLDSTRPDAAGGYVLGSASAVRIANFAGGSDFPQVDITQGGVRPITNLVGGLGTASLRFATAFTGGASHGIASKTTTYTAAVTDHTLLCDATSGAFDVDLPTAASSNGLILVIKKVDASANAVSIDPNGTELIDGTSTSLAISTQWATRTIQSNGTSWFVIGN